MNAVVQPPPASLLDQLRDRQQFVLYKLVPRENGKSDKIPCDPYSGAAIDPHNPANWLLPHEAELWATSWGQGYGVGIVIYRGCGLFAIDFDQCREPSGGWQPHVAAFMQQWFPEAYHEVSVSRTGAHIIGSYHGELPDHRTRNANYRAECYTEARFIALGEPISGSVLVDCTERLLQFLGAYFPPREAEGEAEWRDSPCERSKPIADDGELLRRALRSTSAQAAFGRGASFADLFNANADALARAFPPQSVGQSYDASAADLALANHFAFWTGNDCERMGKLMRESKLVRGKWERADYFRGTILRACSSQTQWYCEPAPVAVVTPMSQAPSVPGPAAVAAVPAFTVQVNGRGKAEATLENLAHVLSDPQQYALIGLDTFRDRIMIAPAGTNAWRAMTDDDMIAMREKLAREQRFAAIGKELMHDALRLIAVRYKFDSAIMWLESLRWDGVPRVGTFLPAYCGTVHDEYTRAVSRYIWSGLAARVLEPGCQLDMVVALLSKQQGLYKSSAMREMVPDPELFTDGLDLHKDDDNFKRMIRGKLVVEIAELAGLSTAAVEYVKRTITRRTEEWIEKWQTQVTSYKRRCMLFATTNNEQFLPKDDTGQRRWLPVEIQRIDRARIKQDREQLWAEGAAICRVRKDDGRSEVEFEDAERLAHGRHAKHEQGDVWEGLISTWLVTPQFGPNDQSLPPPCMRPFTIAEVLQGALLMNKDRMDRKSEMRVAGVLRQLGYEKRQMRVNGQPTNCWARAGT